MRLSEIFVSRELGARDVAIDALRGLAIIGMVLVNHVPPTSERYAFITHAQWTGWTIADTIFPIFLFLVGASISFSMVGVSTRWTSFPFLRVVRRTALLFFISIALVNFPYYELATLKLSGTLSRIAVCYLIAALISFCFSSRVIAGIVLGILALQWWLLTQFDVPGSGRAVFTIAGNASSYLDSLIFGSFGERLKLPGRVMQGLLPVAGSVATTMAGVLVGRWLKSADSAADKVASLFAVGLIIFYAGSLWAVTYPISKQLWTGSYVILMLGISLQLLALLSWFAETRRLTAALLFLQIAGVNALFFYVFAQSAQRVLVYWKVSNQDGSSKGLRYYIFENWFEPWVSGKLGALLYSLVFLSICYAIVFLLYQRRVFVKL
jgi:predicted acyltransferase